MLFKSGGAKGHMQWLHTQGRKPGSQTTVALPRSSWWLFSGSCSVIWKTAMNWRGCQHSVICTFFPSLYIHRLSILKLQPKSMTSLRDSRLAYSWSKLSLWQVTTSFFLLFLSLVTFMLMPLRLWMTHQVTVLWKTSWHLRKIQISLWNTMKDLRIKTSN